MDEDLEKKTNSLMKLKKDLPIYAGTIAGLGIAYYLRHTDPESIHANPIRFFAMSGMTGGISYLASIFFMNLITTQKNTKNIKSEKQKELEKLIEKEYMTKYDRHKNKIRAAFILGEYALMSLGIAGMLEIANLTVPIKKIIYAYIATLPIAWYGSGGIIKLINDNEKMPALYSIKEGLKLRYIEKRPMENQLVYMQRYINNELRLKAKNLYVFLALAYRKNMNLSKYCYYKILEKDLGTEELREHDNELQNKTAASKVKLNKFPILDRDLAAQPDNFLHRLEQQEAYSDLGHKEKTISLEGEIRNIINQRRDQLNIEERILLSIYESKILRSVGAHEEATYHDREIVRILKESEALKRFIVIGEGRNEFGIIEGIPYVSELIGVKRSDNTTSLEHDKEKADFLSRFMPKYIAQTGEVFKEDEKHYLVISKVGEKTLYDILKDSTNADDLKYFKRHIVQTRAIHELSKDAPFKAVEEIYDENYALKRIQNPLSKYIPISQNLAEILMQFYLNANNSDFLVMDSDCTLKNAVVDRHGKVIEIDHESRTIVPQSKEVVNAALYMPTQYGFELVDLAIEGFTNGMKMTTAQKNKYISEVHEMAVPRSFELMAYRQRDILAGQNFDKTHLLFHLDMAMHFSEMTNVGDVYKRGLEEEIEKIKRQIMM